LDESVIRVVERAIDFAPGRRYPSADALKAGLLSLKAGPRTTWWWPAVAAFGVLVLSGLAWDVWSRPGGMERAGVHGLPARPTIAVLPFKNEGGQASEEFVDGLTYEIQKNLAAIDGLELRSPMSSFAFKNQRRDLADIGSRLDVGLVLEGSVFVAGEQLRVNARLTNVADNVALWAETFDRHGKDVFAIQNDIASAIVNKLRLKLGQGQRRYETTPDVYYLFLSARGFQIKGSPENATRAVDLFEQVVAEDPAYVPAWAGLASALGMLARLTQTPDLPPLDPRMEAAALRAIQSDPMSAEAQAAMGSLYARKRNWAESEASFQKAMALNPSLTTTHTDFVLSTLMPLGRLDDAVRVLEAARRADPESLDVRRALAHVQVEAGQYDAAIASCRWVMERNPKFPYIESWLGRALMLEGRTDEALAVFQRGNPNRCAYLGYHLAVTGPRAEAEALAATCEPRGQLMIYGGLGDKDRAFEALELLAEENWWRAATWMRRPELALLRGDPRFDAIKKRLGLPQ
jgi:TolB-like protein/Tfp pilus assembly protein PilF